MSDHFSGPRALAGPVADITDIYAFPSPEHPERLVMVMCTQPLATPTSAFSDGLVYRFRLRPLTIEQDPPRFPFGPEDTELAFACSFAAPQTAADGTLTAQAGYCTTPSGEIVNFRVNDEHGGQGDGVLVYAGLRSDPFFIDLPSLFESFKAGKPVFKAKGKNNLNGANILGIVIEVESDKLVQKTGTPLLGLVCETVVAGKIPVRIERFGRVEIKNVILSMKQFDQVNRDLEIRDLYNLEDAFHMSKDYRDMYRARLNANLAAFDRLDGKVDWPLEEDGSHPLTELLLADYMVVDVSKPFSDDSYFEIEQAVIDGRAHETCGGRSLNNETMATIYTSLINAGNGPRISDGVHQATVPASNVFPYLAAPNSGLPPSLEGIIPS